MTIDKNTIKDSMARFLKLPASRFDDQMELKAIVPDSFMFVELMIELQEEFGVRLQQADAENVHTVSDLAELVAARARP
jgi:acyl carrier protein